MKMLSKNDYQEIGAWMHRNARELEMALWNYHFENGEKDDVINALAYYQNEDGGFGNTVEPDSWNPNSAPYNTLIAIGFLRSIEMVETKGVDHPMVQGIFRFLESGVHTDDEGWFFGIPSNDNYPHAPWWCYDEELNKVQNMGVTAGLCAFILRYADRNSGVFEKASGYAGKILKKAVDTTDFGEMGVVGLNILIRDIQAAGLTAEFEFAGLPDKIKEAANAAIERDVEQWANYRPRPSEFIKSPDSPLYQENKEIVATELDYLIDTRHPGGVWDITWTWFDLNEVYPKEFAISENWWKASKAIEKIEYLKRFGRIK